MHIPLNRNNSTYIDDVSSCEKFTKAVEYK